MKIELIAVVFLLLNPEADSSLLDPVIQNVRHIKAPHPPEKVAGMWKKKMLWKPRWIKEWKQSNVLKPIWKKVWGPVIIREWVPIPKPPSWKHQSASLPLPFKSSVPDLQIFDAGEPPKPNFNYLQNPPPVNGYDHAPQDQVHPGSDASSLGNLPRPPTPVVAGQTSHSHVGPGAIQGYVGDDSGYDLNPPTDPYQPNHNDYSNNRHPPIAAPQAFPPQNGLRITNNHNGHHFHVHSHPAQTTLGHHHHHHHHRHQQGLPPSINTHHPSHAPDPDNSKFPPLWNSWTPLPPPPNAPSAHKQNVLQLTSSSSVSVVSKPQPTTRRPDKIIGNSVKSNNLISPPIFKPLNNDFIQQASLVGEYHYSEPFPSHAKQTTPRPPPPVRPPAPVQQPRHHVNQNNLTNPFKGAHIRNPPRFEKPLPIRPEPEKHRNPHPPVKFGDPKIEAGSKNSTIPVRGQKPEAHNAVKFKPIPESSVATFHYIEAFPTNETQSKASLIGNLNGTYPGKSHGSGRVSVIAPTPHRNTSPALVAKLAEAIVQAHIRNTTASATSAGTSKNATPPEARSTSTAPTATTSFVSVVTPSTIPSVKKTLKSYLAEESSSEKAVRVFIVTPVPQKTIDGHNGADQ